MDLDGFLNRCVFIDLELHADRRLGRLGAVCGQAVFERGGRNNFPDSGHHAARQRGAVFRTRHRPALSPLDGMSNFATASGDCVFPPRVPTYPFQTLLRKSPGY